MHPFRFVHAADLHIDSPFEGLAQVDDAMAERLWASTFEAYTNLVDLCISEQAGFLVIAGDVYDGADRGVRAQRRFGEGLGRLADAGIPSFIAHGNHDPLDRWTVRTALPDAAHVFGPEPEWAEARDPHGELFARLQGVSYPTRVVDENLAARFTPPRAGDDAFTIGVLHCNVGGNPAHDNYAPCTLEDLAGSGLDYWALGHVHSPAERVLRQRAPTVVYPGNTQGRHPNESGPRGAMIVDVDAGGDVSTRFVPLDVLRWETLSIDISGLREIDDLLDAIAGEIETVRAGARGRDLVCRVRLTGRGAIHDSLRLPGVAEEVGEEVQTQASAAAGLTWIAEVRDDTQDRPQVPRECTQEKFERSVVRERFRPLHAACLDAHGRRQGRDRRPQLAHCKPYRSPHGGRRPVLAEGIDRGPSGVRG